jgi:hypothetical protein
MVRAEPGYLTPRPARLATPNTWDEVPAMTTLTILHGYRTLQLSQGFNALIDQDDYPLVGVHKWSAYVTSKGKYVYAVRVKQISGKKDYIFLHRFLMAAPSGMRVDHHNGDTRDHRKENLRLCTISQNSYNMRRTWGRSRYKGVYFSKKNNKWCAYINFKKKMFYLGLFVDERDAARTYDARARELFGEFACTNADLFGDY